MIAGETGVGETGEPLSRHFRLVLHRDLGIDLNPQFAEHRFDFGIQLVQLGQHVILPPLQLAEQISGAAFDIRRRRRS